MPAPKANQVHSCIMPQSNAFTSHTHTRRTTSWTYILVITTSLYLTCTARQRFKATRQVFLRAAYIPYGKVWDHRLPLMHMRGYNSLLTVRMTGRKGVSINGADVWI